MFVPLATNLLALANATSPAPPNPLILAPSNSTNDAVQVVCAWAVSGQYGPGARMLYYALVIVSVFARKNEWMRGACLAAALLFPAVAAIHALILATDSNLGTWSSEFSIVGFPSAGMEKLMLVISRLGLVAAVDMDIFGVLQLCSIGVLAAPITVRYSKTYFNTPGRNIVFLWTILNLAGKSHVHLI